MKHLLLFCAGLCFSVFAHTQTARYDHSNVKAAGVPNPDKLKVTLSIDKLLIVYKNQEIPAASIQVLDSLLKKIPIRENLSIEFESTDAAPEKIRAVNEVLKQCQCPTIKKSRRFNKQ